MWITQEQFDEIYDNIEAAQACLWDINLAINRDRLVAEESAKNLQLLKKEESDYITKTEEAKQIKIDLESKIVALQDTYNANKKNIDQETYKLQSKLDNISNSILEQDNILLNRKEITAKSIEELDKQYNVVKADYDTKIDLLIQSEESKRQTLNDLEMRINNNEEKLKEVQLVVSEQTIIVQGIEDKKKGLETTLATMQSDYDKLERNRKSMEATLLELTSQQAELSINIDTLKQEKLELEAKVVPMREEQAGFTKAKMQLFQDQQSLNQREEVIREKYLAAGLKY